MPLPVPHAELGLRAVAIFIRPDLVVFFLFVAQALSRIPAALSTTSPPPPPWRTLITQKTQLQESVSDPEISIQFTIYQHLLVTANPVLGRKAEHTELATNPEAADVSKICPIAFLVCVSIYGQTTCLPRDKTNQGKSPWTKEATDGTEVPTSTRAYTKRTTEG
jgi:hypothetical protein